jgi:hypothetical protein
LDPKGFDLDASLLSYASKVEHPLLYFDATYCVLTLCLLLIYRQPTSTVRRPQSAPHSNFLAFQHLEEKTPFFFTSYGLRSV